MDPIKTQLSGFDIPRPELEHALTDAQFNGINASDGEYLPIFKVQPRYPRRALERGIEGYVIVEFTVTKTGAVKDIKVVEANPPKIFNQATINAVQKFKYKPRVVDQTPIEVYGVRNKITYAIEQ